MGRRIIVFILVFQAILAASHWFVYRTWTNFQLAPDPRAISVLGVAVAVLSVTFLTASLLAWRYRALPFRIYYRIAAVWLGFFNFFFLAACACWLVYGLGRALRLPWPRQDIAFLLFGLSAAAGLYGGGKGGSVSVR